jgi:transposase
MILDNFQSHKAKIARQYAEDHGINLIYLPPYSPDLNPIEFIWKAKREKYHVNLFAMWII